MRANEWPPRAAGAHPTRAWRPTRCPPAALGCARAASPCAPARRLVLTSRGAPLTRRTRWRMPARGPSCTGGHALSACSCLPLCRGTRDPVRALRLMPPCPRRRAPNPESGARFFENSCTRNRKSRLKRRLFSLLDNIGGIFRFCSTKNTLFSSLPARDRQPLFGVFDGK